MENTEVSVDDFSKIGVSAETSSLGKKRKYQKSFVFTDEQFCGCAIEAGGYWSGGAVKMAKRVAKAAFDRSKKEVDYVNTLGNICQRVAVALQKGVAQTIAACLSSINF